MTAKKMQVVIVGAGNFAKHTGELLLQHDIELLGFVDRHATGKLLGYPIVRPNEALSATKPDGFSIKFLVAISDRLISSQVKQELIELGFSENQIIELVDDNTLTLIESLLTLDKELFCQKILSATSLYNLEKSLLGSRWLETLNTMEDNKPIIGIGIYGKGGGFSKHISDILNGYSQAYNIFYLTDDINVYHSLPYRKKLLISNVAAQEYLDIDIAISAHFIPFSKPSAIKMTFMHVIYDFCLAPNYVASCINASQENHIFIPSSPCLNWFEDLRESGLVKSSLELHPTGYPKLDENRQKFRCYTGPVDTIIYAPTLSSVKVTHHEMTYSLFYGEAIINSLLACCPNHQIIFRPHPSDTVVLTKSSSGIINEQYHKLLKLAESESRFSIDKTQDYMASYNRSAFMVSDTSSTAFTFAFSTDRPVIFFCPRNQELLKTISPVPRYLQDRGRIGYVAESLYDLKTFANQCTSPNENLKQSIDALRSETIYHLDKSNQHLKKFIDKILARRKYVSLA